MKKFETSLVQSLLLIALVVLMSNCIYAGTNNFSPSEEFNGEEFQKTNFPNQLYFEQVRFITVNGISKNTLPDLKPGGNSFLYFCNFFYERLYFKSILPSYQDLQYALKIQIFPSHYFW